MPPGNDCSSDHDDGQALSDAGPAAMLAQFFTMSAPSTPVSMRGI
jgi:hypothetical protein